MKYKLSSLCVALLLAACGGPKAPLQPKAAGVEVTVDTSGANPVISWTAYGSVRATNLVVTSPDCAYGPQKVLVDTPEVTVTGGTERIMFWLLPGKDTKGEGFIGPVVFGSTPPGTTLNIAGHDLHADCHIDVSVAFPDQTIASKTGVSLKQPTNVATADADMKRLGYDKPWFSAKAEAKAKEMPPPDAALQDDFAGTYKLQTINGKPLPKDYGNGCKMTSIWVEAAADGTYKSGYTMSCANGPFESKDAGVYGVTATTAVFNKDPDTEPATRQPDGFTRSYGGDTYVFKRTSKPAPAPAASTPAPAASDAPKK